MPLQQALLLSSYHCLQLPHTSEPAECMHSEEPCSPGSFLTDLHSMGPAPHQEPGSHPPPVPFPSGFSRAGWPGSRLRPCVTDRTPFHMWWAIWDFLNSCCTGALLYGFLENSVYIEMIQSCGSVQHPHFFFLLKTPPMLDKIFLKLEWSRLGIHRCSSHLTSQRAPSVIDILYRQRVPSTVYGVRMRYTNSSWFC